MNENRILILADDLTGANDTAIQFVKQGLSSLLLIHPVPASVDSLNDYNVISVNSDSRGKTATDAYRIVYETIKQFGSGYFVYKKLDSVLRGNPGQELAATMDALDIPLAIAAPSFPANRSFLEDGMLHSGKEAGINAVQIFADGTGRKTENIPLAIISRGAGAVIEFIKTHNNNGTEVFVADAISDFDLDIICRASISLDRPHIMAGSAGLANQFAKHSVRQFKKDPDENAVLVPLFSSALVVAGTRRGETTTQIISLSQEFDLPIIKFKTSLISKGKTEQAIDEVYNEVSNHMKQNVPVCIIAVESMFQSGVFAAETAMNYAEGDEFSLAISKAMGVLTEKLMNSFRFPVFVTTGGDTSLGICQQLGINAIEPLAEICPGIPLGRIVGSAHNGRFIVTKSGRFGNPDTLVEIVKYIGVK